MDGGINNLPDEISIEIFAYLHPNEWFGSLQHVCRKWRDLTLRSIEMINFLSYDSSLSGLIFSSAITGRKYTFDIDQSTLIVKWLIKQCADRMKNVTLEITDIDDNRLKFVKLLVRRLAVDCRKISNLNLSGSVILILKSLNSWKSSLRNLESLTIREDSFLDKDVASCEEYKSREDNSIREQNYVRNTSEFAEYLIRNCRKLRKIYIQFPYVRGPGESCFEYLADLRLESLTWLLYKPYDAGYIEGLLDAISQSSSELVQLNIFSEVKSLNCQKMSNFAEKLSRMPKLSRLSIGFQLMRRSYINDFSSDVVPDGDQSSSSSSSEYFDTIDEAPWTENFLSRFEGFKNLEFLCLRNFDLGRRSANDFASPAIFLRKNLLPKLRRLCFESNYNLDDEFLKLCFVKRAINLQKLEIYTARLKYAVLAEIVVKFCPNLEYLALSNVDGLSFKHLILSLHSSLHCCGSRNDDFTLVKPLIIDLGTSTNFYLDEVDQLRRVEICGLTTVSKSARKNFKIERSCGLK